MHPRRLVRLNELILQTVSQASLNLKDPGIGFITITGAETAPDVSLVKVYYSVLGDPSTREATAEALERAKPHIRHELSQLENLRRTPQLIFIYDESVERADRVNRLLHTIHDEGKPAEAVPVPDMDNVPPMKKAPRGRKRTAGKKRNVRRD
jgi:ribosome-binding factor A